MLDTCSPEFWVKPSSTVGIGASQRAWADVHVVFLAKCENVHPIRVHCGFRGEKYQHPRGMLQKQGVSKEPWRRSGRVVHVRRCTKLHVYTLSQTCMEPDTQRQTILRMIAVRQEERSGARVQLDANIYSWVWYRRSRSCMGFALSASWAFLKKRFSYTVWHSHLE